MRRHPRNVTTEQFDDTGRRQQPRDRVQDRCFSGTIRADEAHDLTRVHRDGHLIDDRASNEIHTETVGAQWKIVHLALGRGASERGHVGALLAHGRSPVRTASDPTEKVVAERMQDGDKTAREIQQHDQHSDAAREKFDLLRSVEDQGKSDDHQRAENGTGDGTDATDDGDRDDPQRILEFERQTIDLELRTAVGEGQQRSGQSGQTAGHRERQQLRAVR